MWMYLDVGTPGGRGGKCSAGGESFPLSRSGEGERELVSVAELDEETFESVLVRNGNAVFVLGPPN